MYVALLHVITHALSKTNVIMNFYRLMTEFSVALYCRGGDAADCVMTEFSVAWRCREHDAADYVMTEFLLRDAAGNMTRLGQKTMSVCSQ